MAVFRENGTKSAVLYPKNPFPGIGAFSVYPGYHREKPVRVHIIGDRKKGKLKSRSRRSGRCIAAKFVYLDKNRVQVGSRSEEITLWTGTRIGIAAVVSNTANALAHGGKAKHIPDADLFSVTLQCHNPVGTLWFMSIAKRVAISAYKDDAVKKRVGE